MTSKEWEKLLTKSITFKGGTLLKFSFLHDHVADQLDRTADIFIFKRACQLIKQVLQVS